jgi:signal transduction histidine kinase
MKIVGFPWTIRTRLSLLYAGAFFAASLALIAFIYFFLGQVIDQQFMIGIAPGTPPLETVPDQLDQAHRMVDVLIRRARVDTLKTMLLASGVVAAVMTVIAGLIGWFVAGQALGPLRSITATARRVADRSLHERIALKGPDDEIKNLADTLDAMLDRLDRSFESQRRFIANASHELRTPLTISRTLIEVALLDAGADEKMKQLGNTLLAVNQRHEKLTEGLLTLAGSDQRAIDLQPVDLADVAGHVVSELRALAENMGVELQADLQPAIVRGDPFLLERMIHNLVENGIHHNLPRGGWVRVDTKMVEGRAEFVIQNTGPIVPAHEIPGLFEPFRRLVGTERLASSAGASVVRGAGLGLSIVRSAVRAHDGEVVATPREGGGLTVRVDIPTN